jgi:M6 family metalloprotease-like protein/uncharacterized repeat protein (TIGR01451 family)
MHTRFFIQFLKAISRILLTGIVLSFFLGLSASSVVRAQNVSTQQLKNNLLPADGRSWSKSGWFSIIWGDSFEGESQIIYTLTDDFGQTTILLLDETLAQSQGGVLSLNHKYVSARGIWADASYYQSAPQVLNVISMSLAQPPGKNILGGGALSAVTGSKPWISIMCKFSDYADEPKNLAYFQGMYASTKPGLDHYWREQSYDIINLVGSGAVGWYTLPQPRSYYVYDRNNDGSVDLDFARAANDCTGIADPYVNFANYAGINLMFNADLDCCAWGGVQPMSLDGTNKIWDITWEPPWGYSDITVMAHEMGHGFGLPHSWGIDASYGNVWDIMGEGNLYCAKSTDPTYGCLGQHTISYHKDILGWIPAGQKFTAGNNTNTTITLEQLAMPQTGNYKMAKIPINGSTTHFYTVEARLLAGYDVKLPGAAVIIHDVDTTRSEPAHVIDADSNGNIGNAGAMWSLGEMFKDTANGIYICVNSATNTGYVVTIGVGIVPTCPSQPAVDFSHSTYRTISSQPKPTSGTMVWFNTTLINSGGTAENVVVTSSVPNNTTYTPNSAFTFQGTVTGNGPIIFDLGTVSYGQGILFAFAVFINDNFVSPTVLSNPILITWNGGSYSLTNKLIANGLSVYLPLITK